MTANVDVSNTLSKPLLDPFLSACPPKFSMDQWSVFTYETYKILPEQRDLFTKGKNSTPRGSI